MKRAKRSKCLQCRFRYGDYCPVREIYLDEAHLHACEDYQPSDDEPEYGLGYSVIEFDEEGHEYYSDDQRL